jgi:ABC-type transporter Mla subunit MlaD
MGAAGSKTPSQLAQYLSSTETIAVPPVRVSKTALTPVPEYNLASKNLTKIVNTMSKASDEATSQAMVLQNAIAQLDAEIKLLTTRRDALQKLKDNAAGFATSYRQQANSLQQITSKASSNQASKNLNALKTNRSQALSNAGFSRYNKGGRPVPIPKPFPNAP